MDWFMIAFIGFLCIVLAYYIERQINDPGVKVFPFNSISQYTVENAAEDQSKTECAAG